MKCERTPSVSKCLLGSLEKSEEPLDTRRNACILSNNVALRSTFREPKTGTSPDNREFLQYETASNPFYSLGGTDSPLPGEIAANEVQFSVDLFR
jgi:hypothetical protein